MRNFLAKTLVTLTILATLTTATFAENSFGNFFDLFENSSEFINTQYRVEAYQTRTHQYFLKAGTTVDVELKGDGYTNLDLYVYDAYGNFILRRGSNSDIEYASMNVNRSEYFTIKVVNLSNDFNNYDLKVWEK
ncbi:MAG TPA: hypothetical protein PKY82_21775 [Pyrinomonadaceae bacterium]|nr:hypothetical protein [Pyrinomonadaceae bacterium]